MSDFAKKIKIIIFVALITVPTIVWTLLGVFSLRDNTSSTEELSENRAICEIDEDVTLKNLTSELEEYYNDRVPFRSKIILKYRKANSKLEYVYQNRIQPVLIEAIGQKGSMENIEVSSNKDVDEILGDEKEAESVDVSENEEPTSIEKAAELEAKGIHEYIVIDIIKPSYETYGYTLKRCQNCGRFLKTDFSEKLIDTTYLPPNEGEGRVIKGRSDWLYYAGDNSIAYYSGTNILSEEEMKEWASLCQELKDACDEKGIKLGMMIMPNKEQVYPEYMPSYSVKTTEKREDVFAKYMMENTDVDFVYPIDELKAGKKYYEMYFPYDTHWTQAGAFVGLMALYEKMGIETTNINDLEVLPTKFTQKGLIDTGSLDADMYVNDTDYVIFYKPEYTVNWFEGEKSFILPSNVYRSTSNNPNNEKVLMIGDSFRLAMIPYLSQDYSTLCVAHRNALDEVKDDLKDADVLIIGSVERFDKYMFEVMPNIIEYVKAR